MIILVFLFIGQAASICVVPNATLPAPAFPKYPDEFRAHITVHTYGPETTEPSITKQNYTSTIDQVYKKSGGNEQGSVIFRDAVLGTAGYIRDVEHQLWFTDAGCMIKDIDELEDSIYEPWHFGATIDNTSDISPFHDVWKWMDSTDKNRKVYTGEADLAGVTCHLFLWCLTPSITFAAYTTDHDVVSVEITTVDAEGHVTRRVFDYRSALSTVAVTREDFLPPPGIFCTSELEVDIPDLEPFYRLDLLLLDGWNITYDAHRVITYSEYGPEGLASIRYPATVGDDIMHKRIVHDFSTGNGHIISEKQGLCMSYTTSDSEASFEHDVLAMTEIAQEERKLVGPVWEVLETLKKGNASPNKRAYRGLITRHGLNIDVWEIGLEDYVAEIGFTKSLHTVPKGNQALQRKLPVSLTVYNGDYVQLAEFDVIEYSAQDNDVDDLYDISECYSANKTLLIQFRLNTPYEKVHEFGVGSFVQGVTKSLVSITAGAHYQFSHVSIAPVFTVQTIVIFTLSETDGQGSVAMSLIVAKLREAIDGQTMYITVADYDRKQVESILPIAQSLLVFDNINIFQHPWQVSVSATISACLGTSFFALLLGALASHWWNKRKLFKTEVRTPTYSKFEDEEYEDEEEGASQL